MKNALRFLVILLGLAAGSEVGAQKLMKSEPAAGAKNVSTDIGVIRLHFNCDMRTDSFTVWKTRAGTFPPTAGDNSRPWKNPRLFELRIGKLKADTRYALQLNADKRKGFQTPDGKPIPVTVITFTTGGAGAAPDQSIGGTAARFPGGCWVRQGKAGREAHHFFPDGRWGYVTHKGEDRLFRLGTWKQKEGVLILQERDKPLPPLDWRSGPGSALTLGSFGGSAPGRFEPRPLIGAADLVGAWKDVYAPNSWRLYEFRSDGTFRYVLVILGKESPYRGRWSLKGLELHLDFMGARGNDTFQWILDGPRRLGLKYMTDEINFYERQGSGPMKKTRPVSPRLRLVGTWESHSKAMKEVYSFTARGQYRRVLGKGGTEVKSGGTWRIEGETLVMKPDKHDTILRHPFRFKNDTTLELIRSLGGKKFVCGFTRRASAPPGGLVGTWTARDQTGTAVIVFSADGRYTREFRSGKEVQRSGGTWKIQGKDIVVRDEKEGETLRIPFSFPGPDTLRMTVEGEPLQLRRKGAAPVKKNRPANLFGRWQVQDKSGAISLELMQSGRYRMAMRNQQQNYSLAGEWHCQGQVIIVVNEANQAELRIPYKLTGSGLTINLEGTEIPLERGR